MGLLQRFAMVVALLMSTSTILLADTYPSRMIRLIVPFPPGATTDFVGRVVGDYLKTKTGQTIVVENVAGAGGNVGMAAAAKAEADGYTLVVVGSSLFTMNPHLYSDLSFDPVRDIAPVAIVGEIPTVFVVNKQVPATSLREFIALAKKEPGKYSYASAGVGTPLHLSVARLAKQAGVELLHVPYRGGAPAIIDVLAGRVDMIGIDPAPVLQYIQDGSMRALAVAANDRLPILPNVPTTAEAGLNNAQDYVWWGVGAPRNTPVAILDQLNSMLREANADPAFKSRLTTIHMQLLSESRAEIEARVKSEGKAWGDFIKTSAIKLN